MSKIHPQTLLRMEAMIRDGLSLSEVAKHLNKSPSSITNLISKHTKGANRLRKEGQDPNNLKL